ncbi:MAG: metallophosphoesterase family protein [Elusimicrobiota bacterium]|nr:metallophosphoesterase family protein [Elusimicrobiota bacterium]
MNWYISDTHFGHERIIKLARRPFKTVEEMDETLARRWNECVKPEDTVYHLGDVAFGSEKKQREILSSLSGRKILVYGNHEKNLALLAECGFKEQHPCLTVQLHGTPVYLVHESPPSLEALPPHCMYCLHGHVHNKPSRHPFLNIAVDLWKFGPISEDEIADNLDIR